MISVIIPAFNEEQMLPRCLTSLTKQTYTDPFEVILVDNGSTDATVAVAKKFQKDLPIRIIQEKKKGRGSARAAGFHAAQGSLLLSTDADAELPSTWIQTLITALNDPNTIAVTGGCTIIDHSLVEDFLFGLLHPPLMHVYRIFLGHYWLSGFNFGIRSDVYEQSGGFDANLNALEDIDLGFRVAKLGKIRYVPIPVIASGRRFHGGIILGSFPYFQAFYDYYFKHHDVAMSDIRT